ncbi:hypothetical protein A0H81_14904 [Grifola frondosa]|uniref:Uncharacterized protein n=1 Tax=Grifola frondosa TaxID=5627 RepID=A0A1C7LQN8_GRIFR|nr:hypothetical protein A0H81_14904 [Grifola frondosa]
MSTAAVASHVVESLLLLTRTLRTSFCLAVTLDVPRLASRPCIIAKFSATNNGLSFSALFSLFTPQRPGSVYLGHSSNRPHPMYGNYYDPPEMRMTYHLRNIIALCGAIHRFAVIYAVIDAALSATGVALTAAVHRAVVGSACAAHPVTN